MKKLKTSHSSFSLIFLSVCISMLSCSSDNDFEYSDAQLSAFNSFRGEWTRTTTGISGDKEETLSFYKQYDEPNFSMDGFMPMGECVLKEYDITKDDFTTYNCYYSIDKDGSVLRLYDKNGKRELDSFTFLFESDTKVVLEYRDPNHLGLRYKIFFKK